ncbi:hypothetical protein LTR37_017483 [Vermiconidia calcicola]|uniref:Uncharacterized protein n=1 Tax=Vermiconidia calcicola TaxID=1690605 RepID=A0ACC3MMR6_9PEZI|nr:hypothetical protein LTR37_017483 [Vermiconidia calcicola]
MASTTRAPMAPARRGVEAIDSTGTEAQLIRYSKHIIELLNARAYNNDFYKTHVSLSVYIDFNGRRTYGLEPLVENYKKDADAYPGFYVALLNESAVVNEDIGNATVILSQELSDEAGEEGGNDIVQLVACGWAVADGEL